MRLALTSLSRFRCRRSTDAAILLGRPLDPATFTPAKSTVHAVLDRHGPVERSRRRRLHNPRGTPLSEATAPNALWCADFTGELKLGNGQYYPLTATAQTSRFLLLCEALESTKEAGAFSAFQHLFREHGLPAALRSDNGLPFASPNSLTTFPSCLCGGCGWASSASASGPASCSRTGTTSACA